jgi:hypothetical protein
MIEAKHKKLYYLFFKFYTHFKIKKHFHKVVFVGKPKVYEKSVLILSNHISWWDGFWINYFNEHITKKKLFFMMLEEQLLKYSFFSKIGGYSVKKNTRDILNSINFTLNLLKSYENAVFLFPQGEIKSLYTNEITFESGIQRILNNVCDIEIVFLCNFIEYFSNQKPTLYMYFRTYDAKQDIDYQKEYNTFYYECKNKNRLQN